MQSPQLYTTAVAAFTHLEIVRNECDAISIDLLSAAQGAEWESSAARGFRDRIWNRISEVSRVGDLAIRTVHEVQAQLDAKGP